MNENRTIHLVDIPIGDDAGLIWNRLHGEREQICEALVKDHEMGADEHREWLHARLRKVDDALDRLMSGSYGNCSKCGGAIDDMRLTIDPALALCLDCWTTNEPAGTRPDSEVITSGEVLLAKLNAFDTVLLRTHNSDYRIMLLDPHTGRALVEGGCYLVEPTEALVRGSAVVGDVFKGGALCVGCRVELWVDERAFLTSPVKSVCVKRNGDPESVQNISTALH